MRTPDPRPAMFSRPSAHSSAPPPKRIFPSSPEDATACLTQFGRGAGMVSTSFVRRKNTTLLFFDADPADVSALASLDLSGFFNSTAYVPALAVPELEFALECFYTTGRRVFDSQFVASLSLGPPDGLDFSVLADAISSSGFVPADATVVFS